MTRQLALVEMVKTDLRQRWQEGRPTVVESYLEFLPELGSRDTIPIDLILAEYEARSNSGAPAELAEFAERFPLQAEELRHWIDSPSRTPGTHSMLDHLGAAAVGPPLMPVSLDSAAKSSIPIPRRFGRYRILKLLGQGAMGTVYLAHDTQLGRRVALKVPHFRTEGDARAPSRHDLDRFYREARAAATLDHPNLCPVYDVGQVDGIPYLTMAYILGRPLSRYIDPDRPMPPRRVAALVRKLALALEEAHRRGIVHRDLKPSNIMVRKRRELVIMDFGLAWRIGTEDARLTRQGLIVGTPGYMSPEQVSGKVEAMGPRCDIYSLGVIMYELLTARRPFEGPEAVVLGQILYIDPTPPSELRPGLDPQIEAICLKAMAKRPSDRYATMSELASALDAQLRRGAPMPQPPPPADEPSGAQPAAAEPLGRVEAAEPGNAEESDEAVCPTVDPSAGESVEAERPAELAESATFWEAWRRWVTIVELIVRSPQKARRVNRTSYERIYKQLVLACRERAATANPSRRRFYQSLESLVLPWLSLKALMQTDPEILYSLMHRCHAVEPEIEDQPQRGSWSRIRVTGRSFWAWAAVALLLVVVIAGVLL